MAKPFKLVVDSQILVDPLLVQSADATLFPRWVQYARKERVGVNHQYSLQLHNQTAIQTNNNGVIQQPENAEIEQFVSTIFAQDKPSVCSKFEPEGVGIFFAPAIDSLIHRVDIKLFAFGKHLKLFPVTSWPMGAKYLTQKALEYRHKFASPVQLFKFLECISEQMVTIIVSTANNDTSIPLIQKKNTRIKNLVHRMKHDCRLAVVDRISGNLIEVGLFSHPYLATSQLKPMVAHLLNNSELLVMNRMPGFSKTHVLRLLHALNWAKKPKEILTAGIESSFISMPFTEFVIAPSDVRVEELFLQSTKKR